MKVGKEEIVGAAAALREFTRRDHEAEAAEHASWLESVLPAVSAWPASVRSDLHFYTRLVVEAGVGTARPLAEELATGSPPIVVPHAPLARGELVVCPEAVDRDDRELVERALAGLGARTPRGVALGDRAR